MIREWQTTWLMSEWWDEPRFLSSGNRGFVVSPHVRHKKITLYFFISLMKKIILKYYFVPFILSFARCG